MLPATLIALVAGSATVFAFAPFGYWPLQIATLALAFHLAQQIGAVRRSALLGWAFGFGWSISSVYWLFISMHRYGGMPAWIAVLAVTLLALVLGLFAALAFGGSLWLQRRWRAPDAVTLLLLLPALWMLTEWLRGWVFTGLPWAATGYAQVVGPLSGFAPVVGVYGIGGCVAFLAGCLVLIVRRHSGFRIGALLLALVVIAKGIGLQYINWTQANGQPISVRLLQGNVPQEMKFSPSQIQGMLTLYHDLIAEKPADLIATPETAIPIFPQQLPPDYLPRLRLLAQQSNSHLLIGIPLFDPPDAYTNGVLGIAPSDQHLDRPPYAYHKHHLVPFGEFVPPGFRWFVNLMHIPLGDFARGSLVQAPFAVKDQWVLPNICYEDIFGEEIAEQIAAAYFDGKPQPTILLNLSNIAWFGDTIALPQHLQISQMRALETKRPMLRTTNTGVTAVIDRNGIVTAQLPTYTRATLSANVQGYTGATPYILFGNAIMLGAALILLGFARFLSRRYRRQVDWS